MNRLICLIAAVTLTPILSSAQHHTGTIVFASYRTGTYQIYSMNASGEHVVQLTDNPSGATEPVVSPRGRRVAFENNVNAAGPTLTIMAIDGSEVVDLVQFESQMQDIAWSPDGSKLTFSNQVNGYYQIFSINADGTNLEQLTHGARSAISSSWDPTGRRILYVSATHAFLDPILFWMNADGTNQQRLALPTDLMVPFFTDPVWSPQGHQVLMESGGDIWLLDLNQDGILGSRNLTHMSNAYEYAPAWSPSGTAFAYKTISDAGGIIWVRSVDGGGLNDLSKRTYRGGGSDHHPSWGRSLIQTPTLIEPATWGQIKTQVPTSGLISP